MRLNRLGYFEYSVAMDMIDAGYDYFNPLDIKKYWAEKLDLS